MREECEEQTDLVAWVNKAERIVTFRETEEFEKLTFRTQEDSVKVSTGSAQSGKGCTKTPLQTNSFARSKRN